QDDTPHPTLIAAERERIGGRQIAAAISDDDDWHPPEGAARVWIEGAKPRLRLAKERGEAARGPEASGARILRIDRELRRHQHGVEARISELAHDLLPGDDIAGECGVVAVEEDDDDSGPGRIERLRRGEQHAAVAVGLVLPVDPST